MTPGDQQGALSCSQALKQRLLLIRLSRGRELLFVRPKWQSMSSFCTFLAWCACSAVFPFGWNGPLVWGCEA